LILLLKLLVLEQLVAVKNHFTSHLVILNLDIEIIGFETTVIGSNDSVLQFNTVCC
jgi:hypothetical protein